MRLRAWDARHVAGTSPQWKFFTEFSRINKRIGGSTTDPRPAMLNGLAENLGERDRWWLIGCYCGPYNVAGAQLISENLPWEKVMDGGTASWLEKNWDALPFRKERRAIRTAGKLARYLESYALWMASDKPWLEFPVGEAYEAAFRDMDKHVWGAGRYIIIRALEMFHVLLGTPTAMPDLRADDAWSPREMLAVLWPDNAEVLLTDTTRRGTDATEEIALATQNRLNAEYGLQLDMYSVQQMLCEYRQSYFSRRQYPGRTLDSELKHWRKASAAGMVDDRLLTIRKRQFPEEHLGEIQGWTGPREDLGPLPRDYGYLWDDMKFDYVTTTDFRSPVLR